MLRELHSSIVRKCLTALCLATTVFVPITCEVDATAKPRDTSLSPDLKLLGEAPARFREKGFFNIQYAGSKDSLRVDFYVIVPDEGELHADPLSVLGDIEE